MNRPVVVMLALGFITLAAVPAARAQASGTDSLVAGTVQAAASPAPVTRRDGLVALVPALANDPYHLAPGPRPFAHRLVVTPSYGTLGPDRLFLVRVGYAPCDWLAYEAEVGHTPSRSVSTILHRFNLVVRRPLTGRLQPFVDAGYGMVVVLPGRSFNADPITRNMLAVGGGVEFYLRDDLALRAETRRSAVFGNQANRSGLVAYEYAEQTLGLEFHRFLQP
jgi:hypothetical protein